VNKTRTTHFLRRANEVHGLDKYDYSQVDYVNAKRAVTIVCPAHGVFRQTPDTHLSGSGCPQCALANRADKRRLAPDKFIARCRELFGERYDYSKIGYQSLRHKVEIICPDHGKFTMTPGSHLKGHLCPRCTGRGVINQTDFLRRATATHGERYDYSLVLCTKKRAVVTIICPQHGMFEQTPYDHLRGRGCSQCASLQRGMLRRSSTDQFIARAMSIHGVEYDYSLVEYKRNNINVLIGCRKSNHGLFQQTPANHLLGRGCPACSKSGFDGSKPAVLYYLSICGGVAFKIGITNRSINQRFCLDDIKKITIHGMWRFEIGAQARQWEKKILRSFDRYRYKGEDLLSNGNSELFCSDVLGVGSIRSILDAQGKPFLLDDQMRLFDHLVEVPPKTVKQ
jgi:hypothetical protein